MSVESYVLHGAAWVINASIFSIPDQGTVQKVIVLPKEQGILEELTLEEVEVFRVSKETSPVTTPTPCYVV